MNIDPFGFLQFASDKGKFHGVKYKVLKNKQGFFKIQINQAGYWRDLTHNDTALCIVGRGNPDHQLFTTEAALDSFIDQHFKQKPIDAIKLDKPVIDQNWTEKQDT